MISPIMLGLNVFKNGEVAVSGGTSGVLYCVTNNIKSKESSRINHFGHVNQHQSQIPGKLLCINGQEFNIDGFEITASELL